MKRFTALLLALVMTFGVLTSCAEPPHEHEWVLDYDYAPSCLAAGEKGYVCSCGETQTEEYGEALDHDYRTEVSNPTCTENGKTTYICKRCYYSYYERIKTTGHSYADSSEPSRLCVCSNCAVGKFMEGTNEYADQIVFTLTEEKKAEIADLYDEIKAILDEADAYDETLHAYVESGALYDEYMAVEDKYEELYDLVLYVVTQYQIAQLEYHVDMKNEEKKDRFSEVSEYRTSLVADFYSFSQPFYDSLYRDFFYYGMTEEEIMEYIYESNAVSNEEYVALRDRNEEIELEFDALSDPTVGGDVLALYEEFVENNKKIAEIMGYESYVDYAYENVYDRDYSSADTAQIAEFVKEHFAAAFKALDDKYKALTGQGLSQKDYNTYLEHCFDSFFESIPVNTRVNDYIDMMEFTTNPDKQITFSDALNDLISKGGAFRGSYEGAYVTYLQSLELPIAYFGPEGYDSAFTVVHEFGHYMNEIYNDEEYDQSYDLLEMHSQGNELLYLCALADMISEEKFELIELIQLYSMCRTVALALAVDRFEYAVYTNTYDGPAANALLADGKFTASEYDQLFTIVLNDLGFGDTSIPTNYWRYVTISAPCYYVSYSISALSVLQIYVNANNDGFDEAKDSYLALFTYTDENPDMTTMEILEYAGLYSFTDENLFVELAAYISSMAD